jgi:uncharacterized membrane protein
MSDASTAWSQWPALARSGVVRLVEIALAAIGIGYFLADNRVRAETNLLGLFDLIALMYLLIGFFVVRRHRRDHSNAPPLVSANWITTLRRRASFLLTVVASLTGLQAASDVLLHGAGEERSDQVRVLGVIAVIIAWTLLHVGYAKFYRNIDSAAKDRGLRFPKDADPAFIDYLYFSITLGVSFAASDVEVINRTMRWHVLVHEIVSFFYNTAVLAIAVGTVIGR